VSDLLGTALANARAVADDVLFPAAQATDVAPLVPQANLDALRDAGLHGLQGPADVPGGLGADHVAARPILEAITGGCGATAFVYAQHHGAVRRVAAGDGPARVAWLPRLCDGSTLAGIGFAYLRRPGPPAVTATSDGDAWRLDGAAPWITGWGLAEVFVLMGRADDGRVVTVAVDRPYERDDLSPGPPQRLAAMGATGTVALTLRGLRTAPEDLVGVQSDEGWRRRDLAGSAMPSAAPLGIADRAIRLLEERAPETAAALSARLEERRHAADDRSTEISTALGTAGDEAERLARAIAEGSAERDRGLDLARRATDALVAASGGGAISLDHPAQRLSREATFYLIQAQTGDLRAATLARTIRA
jgi:alkylation response protein AidB-like acyl-CoA dehydrogenase